MSLHDAAVIASTSNLSEDSKEKIKANCDKSVKRILRLSQVAARIFKGTIPQFKDMDVETIIRDHIIGEIEVSTPVAAYQLPKTVNVMDTESSEPNEATIYYDMKCRLRLADGDTADCFIIVDLEGQNNFTPGYSLSRRAIYYASRLMSSQLAVVGKDTKYDSLSKVLTIWICFEPSKEAVNSITRINLKQESLVGTLTFDDDEVDMMEALFITLGPDGSSDDNQLISFLSTLFSTELDAGEKLKQLNEKFNFPITDETTEEVSEMTNAMNATYGFRTEKAVRDAMDVFSAMVNWLKKNGRENDAEKALSNRDARAIYLKEFIQTPEYFDVLKNMPKD